MGGSDDSFRALDRTVERAALANDELVVAVLDNPSGDADPDEIVGRVHAALAGTGVSADVRRLTGDPGSRLVALADAGRFDQIVLGGGQRSPMGKVKIGDIAEFVLLNASTTVKLVR
jgi:nucleotide-binding universal stress UspA family protein